MQSKIEIENLERCLAPLYDHFQFVRALFMETDGLTISSNLNQTFAEPLPQKRGVVFSVLQNGVLHEGSSVVHSIRDVKRTIEKLRETVRKSTVHGSIHLEKDAPLKKQFLSPVSQSVDLHERIHFSRSLAHEIKAKNNSVAMASTRFRQTNQREIFVSQTKSLEQEIPRFEAIFSAVLKNSDGSQTAQIYDGYGKRGSWECMKENLHLIDAMLVDGERILSAPRLTPGMHECIFSPSLAGILAHEAFGHGTEADTMLKGRAKGSDYMGKRVASDLVYLYDSPALENQAASYFFDHEGFLARETRIVEAGILNEPMTDQVSANLLGIKRTPNGRRENYDHKIYTRMTNTFFKEGKDSLDAMIASMDDGYLIDRATNGMEDPKSWGIQLEALVARRIRRGKLTDEYFSPVIITGDVPEILQSISMVSSDFLINGLGMCGKGYKEWVKVTDGGPYLKLRARLA